MELFRGIHEVVRDKAADELYAHLLALGIQGEMLHGHPLQEVGAKKGIGIKRKSLGLVQVAGKNIGYVTIIKERRSGSPGFHGQSTEYIEYYLEYLVPLTEIPSSLWWAKLDIKKRGLFRREVVDIEWAGGTLADALNGDLALKQGLLMEFRLNRPLGIEIAPEPAYRCARIETEGLRFRLPLQRGLNLPSASLFDCLDRIAGHIAPHVTEVNSRPETVLLEAKIEFNPGSKDAEVADCYVTDRHVRIESKEPLQIALYMVEDCDVGTPLPSFGAGATEVSYSTVMLKYRDELGHRRKVKFEMQTFDASCLQSQLRHSYPCGITP